MVRTSQHGPGTFKLITKKGQYNFTASQVVQSLLGTSRWSKPLVSSQLAQQRCDNVVTTLWLTLSQHCGTVENESCADVSFRRSDNVAVRRCQDVATTLLQRGHNIKHWISRPFYYGLF